MPRLSILERLERLNKIGVGLSAEKDHHRLLGMILTGAKEIAGADGGTLYLLHDDRRLHFELVMTDSLGVTLDGQSRDLARFTPIPLYREDGRPNLRTVASCAVLEDRTINIADVYDVEDYDFSGTRKFDRSNGYRTRSMLAVPMKDHAGTMIGVLQLLNAVDPDTRKIIPFSDDDERLVASLASQAAVSINQQRLVAGLEELFRSMVRLIANAIDEKSPHTGGHCRRVPVMTMILAQAVNEDDSGAFADMRFTPQEMEELEMAAWLHDCGKITTPEYVVDKQTKLQAFFDRISLLDARLDTLRSQREPRRESGADTDAPFSGRIEEMREFLHRCNDGEHELSRKDREALRALSRIRIHPKSSRSGQALLSDDELYNLLIDQGTLNREERAIVKGHIDATISMLESLPFPDHLKNVPGIAGAHHERVDGSGYPRGLSGSELSLQARILALADVYEALTAVDRPYREAATVEEVLEELEKMVRSGHIDPDLYRLFKDEKLYLKYAEKAFDPRNRREG